MAMNNSIKYMLVLLLFAFCRYPTYSQGRRMPAPAFHRTPAFENRVVARQQNQQPARARLEAARMNFYNHQLKLTTDQADKFWPVYRNYQQELTAVAKLKRQNNLEGQPNGIEQINKNMEYDSQLLEIRKKYNEAFLKILPPDKVSELYKSERAFHDELIKQLSERKEKEAQQQLPNE
jgi:hypothetical protein